ncbi:MAG: metal ABC transporter permease [Trueperaceae bacterium]|nr:metal ABC transporter permease [Trueperaceae bacterium]
MDLLSLLSDFTIRNVTLGAMLLGISSGVLGSFAVLRKQSLLGDMLSHAALPGICLGFIIVGSRQLLPLLLGALVSGTAAALFMLLLINRSRLKTDAALGSALSFFFAIGIVLLTYIQAKPDANQAGLTAFLFGQAASIVPSDLWILGSITVLALGIVLLFWKEFKVVTFDLQFANTLGFPTGVLEILLTSMVALAVVMGLQFVGVILMAAMIIAPAVAARQWTERLELMVFLAALFGALSGIVGALISALARGLATGPVIVLCASAIVLVSLLFAPNRGLVWASWQTRQQHKTLRSRQLLSNLYKLGLTHADPHYRVEETMMNAYYGMQTRDIFKRLESRGLIKQSSHMPEEGRHWELTPNGIEEARQFLHSLGNGDMGQDEVQHAGA